MNKQQPMGEYVEQEWQKLDGKGVHDDLEWAIAEGNDEEEWECVVCNKSFRSEAAWDSHERSKKVRRTSILCMFLPNRKYSI